MTRIDANYLVAISRDHFSGKVLTISYRKQIPCSLLETPSFLPLLLFPSACNSILYVVNICRDLNELWMYLLRPYDNRAWNDNL